MITLEYMNRLRHVANQEPSEAALIEMLEMLIPALPPMVGGIVSEFLQANTEPNPHINTEDTR